jgi:ketosteroid isomerase-like protein
MLTVDDTPTGQQMNDDPILDGEAALIDAQFNNDVAALDQLLDDELMFTALDGLIATKKDDLNAHRARRLRLKRSVPTDRRIQRLGDVAVVNVRMEMAGTYDGAPFAGAYRYTRVWCKRPGGWRIVAGHISRAT